jgi:hypothetical protein
LLGEVAADDDVGSCRTMIDTQIVAAFPHELRPSSWSSIFTTGRAPTARIADGGKHVGHLELQVHRHRAATRSIGVLYGIGAGFTDSDE